jgi:Kdo2-lipid IVA lauroyltransferase/acyltransferase
LDRIGVLVSFVFWTLAHSPLSLARFYTTLMDKFVPRLRRVARRNLELAYPDRSAAEREAIIDQVFQSLARMLWTFVRLHRINALNVGEWIRYDGLEHFLDAKQKGHGVLFATAHLGNWELSAFAHALMTEPMDIVVRPLDNPGIDKIVEARRTLSGNRVIGKWDAARPILRALAANRAVGILMDQNTSLDEGVFVNFFGTPACANVAFAKIAARTGAPVIPGFALWSDQEQRYILKFYPPVPMTGDAENDTQSLHSVLEQVIREHPGQWLWIHRRWKTRPPGQPPLY